MATRSRIRVRGESEEPMVTVISAVDKKRLTELTDGAYELDKQIKDLTKKNKVMQKDLDKEMKKHGLGRFEGKKGVASYEVPQGRSSRVVDVKAFKKKVSESAFWNSITVLLTEAKKHLGEKELDEITKTYPPKKKDPVLVVNEKGKT